MLTSGRGTELPRFVVAAPGSGHGKTMIATGLMAALRARGLRVSPHKVGPDYIDPSYHGLAAGRVGRNLDPFLCGEELMAPLLLHGASTPEPADVAVIEGVMGLFDGALGTGGFASTAHVARLVEAPVVLVVDCAASARSVGAVVHGFATYDERVQVAGVILNNVASPRHEREARDGITDSLSRASLDVESRLAGPGRRNSTPTGARLNEMVLGVVPRLPDIVVPSRHLGLVPVAERRPEAVAAVEALATLITEHVDLDALMRLARSAPALEGAPWSPHPSPPVSWAGRAAGPAAATRAVAGEYTADPDASGPDASGPDASGPDAAGRQVDDQGPPVVAVFGGPAFSFTYAENVEQLRACGADVVVVDPLRGDRLPERTAAVVIGGGFPEMHVDLLARNRDLLDDVARFARRGGPLVAECAGLLYLGRTLDPGSGQGAVPMAGVLAMAGAMSGRLTLGYRRATALTDSPVVRAGEEVTGHEFHRTQVVPDAEAATDAERNAWQWSLADGTPVTEGWASDTVHASYLHVHGAGHPDHAQRLVAAARAFAAAPAERVPSS